LGGKTGGERKKKQKAPPRTSRILGKKLNKLASKAEKESQIDLRGGFVPAGKTKSALPSGTMAIGGKQSRKRGTTLFNLSQDKRKTTKNQVKTEFKSQVQSQGRSGRSTRKKVLSFEKKEKGVDLREGPINGARWTDNASSDHRSRKGNRRNKKKGPCHLRQKNGVGFLTREERPILREAKKGRLSHRRLGARKGGRTPSGRRGAAKGGINRSIFFALRTQTRNANTISGPDKTKT